MSKGGLDTEGAIFGDSLETFSDTCTIGIWQHQDWPNGESSLGVAAIGKQGVYASSVSPSTMVQGYLGYTHRGVQGAGRRKLLQTYM